MSTSSTVAMLWCASSASRRLVEEHRAGLRIRRAHRIEDLQRDLACDRAAVTGRQVDVSHSAAGERAEQLVWTESQSGRRALTSHQTSYEHRVGMDSRFVKALFP